HYEAPGSPTAQYPRDSSTRIATMCAYPRAPPEPSDSATRMPLPPSSRLSPGRPGPRVRGTGARVTVRSGGYSQPCGKCVATRESRGPAASRAEPVVPAIYVVDRIEHLFDRERDAHQRTEEPS